MTDGGPHFDCNEVKEFCAKWGIKHYVVAKYSPWINGLAENANKLLLYVLARLCAPDVGEDEWKAMTWEKLPTNWPLHVDEAARVLNSRVLPSVKFTPKEILLGMVVNTPRTPLAEMLEAPTDADYALNMAYVAQQRLDGYAERIKYALGRKAAFDRKVIASRAGEVTFEKGQLVQVAGSVWDYTFKTLRKLIHYWSTPYRVRGRLSHSYKLETIQDDLLDGDYSSRRLRAFVPKIGGRLEAEQGAWMAAHGAELKAAGAAEVEEVEARRAAEVGASLE